MEQCIYKVEIIDGDYAHLRKADNPEGDLKLVARALLPPEIREGTSLCYENFEYSMLEL